MLIEKVGLKRNNESSKAVKHGPQTELTQPPCSLSLFYLQKFTGHSTAVTTLCFATTRPPDSNGLYFLSGAAHDRLLSVW